MESKSYTDIEQNYQKLLELEPKLITNTIPANAKEQKALFIAGEMPVPQHVYPRLDIDDSVIDDIQELGRTIAKSPELNKKHAAVYEAFVDGYAKKTRMMQTMHEVKIAETEELRDKARKEFMALNIELYGAPDKDTYASLLMEKITSIAEKKLPEKAQILLDELQDMLPSEYTHGKEVSRFRPSAETVKWMQGAAETLYGSMLDHVPEQETFEPHEVREIFVEIIKDEFGGAADKWRVDIEEAKSINVKSAEKRLVIPEDRGVLTRDEVRKLVVHEIGVHVLRSIAGEQTDLGPLRTGLSEYYESEEGLGKVMEQALLGEYVEAGVDHYITAGAAYFDHKNFRDTYEMKWRIGALQKLEEGEDLTEEAVKRAKLAAYGSVMRVFRGTDELPWFKDLAYYNGTADTWKFLESIRGDDFRLTLLMMGKMNTSHEHLQSVLETKTA